MSSRRSFRILASIAIAAAVCGCSTVDRYVPSVRNLGVYKLDINQGNYVTEDMVVKLKPGQSKQQVRAILGTPLVSSAFRDNRWDYVYEYTKQGVLIEHRKLTVFFEDEKLARWEGDEMPTSAAELNRSAAAKSMSRDPGNEGTGFFDWVKGIFSRK